MFKILVAEDDKSTAILIKAVLKKSGYEVFRAENGIDALQIMEKQHIDLIVLDVMMPKMDGYVFADELRSCNNYTPILMVTSKNLLEDKKAGFTSGADDYLVKPFDDEELLLRIKALLRRSKIASEHKIQIGNVTLDYNSLTVSKGCETMLLPQKEFQLLFKLLSYPNKIFTRIELMDEIWGVESETSSATVDVHINRLRKRFADFTEFQIITIRGIGYKAIKND